MLECLIDFYHNYEGLKKGEKNENTLLEKGKIIHLEFIFYLTVLFSNRWLRKMFNYMKREAWGFIADIAQYISKKVIYKIKNYIIKKDYRELGNILLKSSYIWKLYYKN